MSLPMDLLPSMKHGDYLNGPNCGPREAQLILSLENQAWEPGYQLGG